MSLKRSNPRRDANEPALIKALKTCGFAVSRLSGAGLPDLLVSRRGHWHLLEVKMPKGRTKASQADFSAQHSAPVLQVRSVPQVVAFSGSVP